jgi:hypothetical protein
MAVPLKDVYEELQFISDRISTQVRAIALSVLALVWLFLAGGSSAPALVPSPDRRSLLAMAAFGLAALVSDYLQYLFGYWATSGVRKTAERAKQETAEFIYTDARYRARVFCFWLKQVLTLVAVGWLMVALLRAMSAS